MLKRCITICSRKFSKLPVPLDEVKAKEKEATQAVYDEEIERSKKKLDTWFPDPFKAIERKEYPTYPSMFGQSDEEDTPAFFLEDLAEFQYVYAPLEGLVFDAEGFAMIYQARTRFSFAPSKLRYAWKLIFPVFLSIGLSIQAIAHSNLAILLSWSVPFIVLTQAMMVSKIYLNKDGRHIKVDYKRFKLFPKRSKTFEVSSFKEPSGDAFIFWSVYEFPDDLRTFNENPNINRVSFAKRISWWSFLLMPGHPVEMNREILINVLNGIYIDASQKGSEEIKSRYFILEPKKK